MPKKIKLKAKKSEILQEDVGKIEQSPTNIFELGGELVIDVFETNSDFVVLTAIAGAQIKDIDISVEKEMMVINGNRLEPHNNSEKKYFYQECYWGPFSRKVVLPENIDTEKASAQMDKGILTIKIPKITNSPSQKITDSPSQTS